jgi:uncharacterized protein YecE (DUF72 family)
VGIGTAGSPRARIGTAGWAIPRASAHRFAPRGTHLERYAATLSCVEINSAFYRPHARGTYVRWAAATPAGFRFSVKVPRLITHDQRLRRPRRPLERFLAEVSGLGGKRGPLLVQLPPSLEYDARVANRFFECLRAHDQGPVVCEPRHPTWFTAGADRLLRRHRVARVAADPSRAEGANAPGGWEGLAYFRWHGSPRMYWSRYDDTDLQVLARMTQALPHATEIWVVFDNTASGSAIENAWELQALLTTTARSVD